MWRKRGGGHTQSQNESDINDPTCDLWESACLALFSFFLFSKLKNEQMPFRHCRWFVVPPPRSIAIERRKRPGPLFFFLFFLPISYFNGYTSPQDYFYVLCVCIYCNYLRVGRLYTSLPWISIARSYLKYVFVHISVINILCWGLGGRVNGLIARPLPT